ncbi:dTDP-dehydrorhamnose reductase [Vibrio nigripulchritudo MADA3029]|uniref:dTDP-4-dehydrorhamnose reductase n=1 Tax=Vibrio nigripulchritudo TaxID=28173 RepID=UPI0003B18D63|nr:dTDP-4-dehydrorhamnose reductase [Vibrio nigripulchritudo]CCN47635.1 dTDP-dehydrorhamnose reductase [Vibrio nigripulchritudo MADA3020]CCN56542.1 dTDP-dehydrorhamnose reductase [Vibrio nigripulchritudo MADA3021]CCN58834.1 dTDP-dehydrorhamnose reductase [Vibrio nigripulchritudo MADA3029]
MKVLVTGCHGQVGYCLIKRLKKRNDINLISYGRKELDITSQDAVFRRIESLNPDVIINAAAYTAVDNAETDVDSSYSINRDGPKYLAQAAELIGALLLHISTDYVFNGSKQSPYIETDSPDPQCVYGQSKLAGELMVQEHCKRYGILRTAWVFGEHGNNFVKTMLRLGAERHELGIIGDQLGGPTYADDIAIVLVKMMDKYVQSTETPSGVFHYSGSPHVSWYQFACAIFEQVAKHKVLERVPTLNEIAALEYPAPAPRPQNSRLNCQKITKVFNVVPSDWKHALENIREYQQ